MPVKMTHYTWTTTTAVFLDVFLLGFLVIAPKCSALSDASPSPFNPSSPPLVPPSPPPPPPPLIIQVTVSVASGSTKKPPNCETLTAVLSQAVSSLMLPFSPITCAIIVSQATLVWSMASVQHAKLAVGQLEAVMPSLVKSGGVPCGSTVTATAPSLPDLTRFCSPSTLYMCCPDPSTSSPPPPLLHPPPPSPQKHPPPRKHSPPPPKPTRRPPPPPVRRSPPVPSPKAGPPPSRPPPPPVRPSPPPTPPPSPPPPIVIFRDVTVRTSETWLGLRVTADFARTALCPSLRKALTAVGADLGFGTADWAVSTTCTVNSQASSRGVFYKVRVTLSSTSLAALNATTSNPVSFAHLVEQAQVLCGSTFRLYDEAGLLVAMITPDTSPALKEGAPGAVCTNSIDGYKPVSVAALKEVES